MKLTNFRCYERSGTSALNYRFHAKVDVTTGVLWWKKTQECEIQRRFADFWFFVADGTYTPGFQAERLEKAANARLEMPLA